MGRAIGYEYQSGSFPEGGDGSVKTVYYEVTCKHCGSRTGINKFGTLNGNQLWWCKNCERKFVDNSALPRMRTPINQVGFALAAFYDGASLSDISRQLDQLYGKHPAGSSIYAWIQRFSRVAVDETRQLKPKVGDTWVADETVLQIGGKNIWFWDIMDAKTRFLLASHMSVSRNSKDAQTLMEDAAKRAGKAPKIVITDKLLAYLDGIELAFGADTKHIQSQGFSVQPNTNLIERLHGSIKERTKVMRGLKNVRSAYLFMDGWTAYYNFFRVHSSLGKTPAEAASIEAPYRNWLGVAEEKQRPRAGQQRETVILGFAQKHKPRRHRGGERMVSEVSRTMRVV
jgi:transposase-like protein